MECNSVHSAIECKLKGKEIYLPSQYVNITKLARDNSMPYESRSLEFSFYTDFSKELVYKHRISLYFVGIKPHKS